MNEPGLFELLITEALDAQLRQLPTGLAAIRQRLRPEDAADRLALHLSHVVARAVNDLPEDERVKAGIALARQLVDVVAAAAQDADADADADAAANVATDRLHTSGESLQAIAKVMPDGQPCLESGSMLAPV